MSFYSKRSLLMALLTITFCSLGLADTWLPPNHDWSMQVGSSRIGFHGYSSGTRVFYGPDDFWVGLPLSAVVGILAIGFFVPSCGAVYLFRHRHHENAA